MLLLGSVAVVKDKLVAWTSTHDAIAIIHVMKTMIAVMTFLPHVLWVSGIGCRLTLSSSYLFKGNFERNWHK